MSIPHEPSSHGGIAHEATICLDVQESNFQQLSIFKAQTTPNKQTKGLDEFRDILSPWRLWRRAIEHALHYDFEIKEPFVDNQQATKL
jgi:hypothetical protein